MKKKQKNKFTQLVILLGFLILGTVVYFGINTFVKNTKLKSHTSQALKISFEYPRDWYVDEKNRNILITSFVTFIGEGKKSNNDQIRITIDQASLCQKTLDQEVLLGGCGEGVNSKNEILSKEKKEFTEGSFITYKIKYPNNQQAVLYYHQKGDRILQISKQPDPSKFEKEFEEIIDSIEFKNN